MKKEHHRARYFGESLSLSMCPKLESSTTTLFVGAKKRVSLSFERIASRKESV